MSPDEKKPEHVFRLFVTDVAMQTFFRQKRHDAVPQVMSRRARLARCSESHLSEQSRKDW